MNPRHAAALALVGWYLMLPPVVPVEGPPRTIHWSEDAPLNQWKIAQSFDTAAECTATMMEERKASHERLKKRGATPEQMATMDKFMATNICVASDDPRLKGN